MATPTSGLAKSSSRSPQARSMARAPARLAPSINVWLRGFGAGCVTASLPLVDGSPRVKKLKAITLPDDGLKFPFAAWLGHHHPLWFLRTAAELVRRTTRGARSVGFAETVRPLVMATWSIAIATENNSMKVLAQSVKLILMLGAINRPYSSIGVLEEHLYGS